jgi:hypothetical protein
LLVVGRHRDRLFAVAHVDLNAAPTLRLAPSRFRKKLAMSSALGGNQITSRPQLSVVAVSEDPQRAALMDALLADASLRDVVFVESIAHGYWRIKQLTPDVVVVLLGTTCGCPPASVDAEHGSRHGGYSSRDVDDQT